MTTPDPSQQRSSGKTGILENVMRDAASERRLAATRDAERDAAQLAASLSRETRWFRLAMAELLVIVSIAVVILGRSMTVEGVGTIGPGADAESSQQPTE